MKLQITAADLTQITNKTHNWKAPVVDGTQRLEQKLYLTLPYTLIAQHFTQIIQNPQNLPQFLTEGITYIIQNKTKNPTEATNYRPIMFHLTRCLLQAS